MANGPEVSVVIPTYNRSHSLSDTLNSVLLQHGDTEFEIVVVDNNSIDDTFDVVHSFMAEHPGKIRYVVETHQGNAYARNSGIENALGKIIAFVDDDITVQNNWMEVLIRVLRSRPDLAFVGGSVLPQWSEVPPSWLTPDHWAPLALLDYGPSELPISRDSPRGLLTANIAFRRNVFDEVGMFSPDLQRVNDGIGSMEDHEFLLRVCRSGRKGVYLPDMVAESPVSVDRLTKEYHRRWHTGHGHFYAVMCDPEWERSKFHLIGVPSHLFRQAATEAVTWVTRTLTGNTHDAFVNECRLRFFHGFLRQRRNQISKSASVNRDIR